MKQLLWSVCVVCCRGRQTKQCAAGDRSRRSRRRRRALRRCRHWLRPTMRHHRTSNCDPSASRLGCHERRVNALWLVALLLLLLYFLSKVDCHVGLTAAPPIRTSFPFLLPLFRVAVVDRIGGRVFTCAVPVTLLWRVLGIFFFSSPLRYDWYVVLGRSGVRLFFGPRVAGAINIKRCPIIFRPACCWC
jgi:hypothetical protein